MIPILFSNMASWFLSKQQRVAAFRRRFFEPRQLHQACSAGSKVSIWGEAAVHGNERNVACFHNK